MIHFKLYAAFPLLFSRPNNANRNLKILNNYQYIIFIYFILNCCVVHFFVSALRAAKPGVKFLVCVDLLGQLTRLRIKIYGNVFSLIPSEMHMVDTVGVETFLQKTLYCTFKSASIPQRTFDLSPLPPALCVRRLPVEPAEGAAGEGDGAAGAEGAAG